MAFKKTELNDYCQANKVSVEGYDTRQVQGGFVSSLRCGDAVFKSTRSHPTKKAAENDVASVALEAIKSRGLGSQVSRDEVDPRSGQASETNHRSESYLPKSGQIFETRSGQGYNISTDKFSTPILSSPIKPAVPCTAVPTDLQSDKERVTQILTRYCQLKVIPFWHSVKEMGKNRYTAMVRVGDREINDPMEHDSFEAAKHSVNILAMKEFKVEEFLREYREAQLRQQLFQQPAPPPTNVLNATGLVYPYNAAPGYQQYTEPLPLAMQAPSSVLVARGGGAAGGIKHEVQLDGSSISTESDSKKVVNPPSSSFLKSQDTPSYASVSNKAPNQLLLTPNAFKILPADSQPTSLASNLQQLSSSSLPLNSLPVTNQSSFKPIQPSPRPRLTLVTPSPNPLPSAASLPTSSLTIPSFPASLPLPTRNNAKKKNVNSPTGHSPLSLAASIPSTASHNSNPAVPVSITSSTTHSHIAPSPSLPISATESTSELYYKQMLNDYIQKHRLPVPVYSAEYSPDSVGYIGIVKLGGVEYQSPPDKNKKRALNLAARAALVSRGIIKDEKVPPPPVSSGVSYKNLLQEYFQKNKYPLPQYNTVGVENEKFACTLTCTDGRRQSVFKGIECTTKKLAEQSAAEKACIAFKLT